MSSVVLRFAPPGKGAGGVDFNESDARRVLGFIGRCARDPRLRDEVADCSDSTGVLSTTHDMICDRRTLIEAAIGIELSGNCDADFATLLAAAAADEVSTAKPVTPAAEPEIAAEPAIAAGADPHAELASENMSREITPAAAGNGGAEMDELDDDAGQPAAESDVKVKLKKPVEVEIASELGWFVVQRRWFTDPVFRPGPFTQREAWFWLLSEAAWRPRQKRFRDYIVNLERGQVATSDRFMAKAWRWEKTKVRRYLARLREAGWIETETDEDDFELTETCTKPAPPGEPETAPARKPSSTPPITVITICNYDDLQADVVPAAPPGEPETAPAAQPANAPGPHQDRTRTAPNDNKRTTKKEKKNSTPRHDRDSEPREGVLCRAEQRGASQESKQGKQNEAEVKRETEIPAQQESKTAETDPRLVLAECRKAALRAEFQAAHERAPPGLKKLQPRYPHGLLEVEQWPLHWELPVIIAKAREALEAGLCRNDPIHSVNYVRPLLEGHYRDRPKGNAIAAAPADDVDDVNLEAWLRGEIDYERHELYAAALKRYGKKYDRDRDLVEYLIHKKIIPEAEVDPERLGLLRRPA
jgi:hypothetical protein